MQENIEDTIQGFQYAWYKTGAYSIITKTYLTLGEGKANEVETEEIWNIHPKEYGHIDLEISEKKYLKSDSQMKPFYDILEKVNDATNHLSIVLNEDKTIAEIENKEEILEKWDEIKRKELRFLQLVKDSYNEMIGVYDKEFEKIDQNIKSNLLYQVLFYPFPNSDKKGSFKEKMPLRTILSTMFPGESVSYSSNCKVNKTDTGHIMTISGKNHEIGKNFNSIYASRYQKSLNMPLDYEMTIEGEYHYDENSVLVETVFYMREKLNEKMLYVCRYHIQLLK